MKYIRFIVLSVKTVCDRHASKHFKAPWFYLRALNKNHNPDCRVKKTLLVMWEDEREFYSIDLKRTTSFSFELLIANFLKQKQRYFFRRLNVSVLHNYRIMLISNLGHIFVRFKNRFKVYPSTRPKCSVLFYSTML